VYWRKWLIMIRVWMNVPHFLQSAFYTNIFESQFQNFIAVRIEESSGLRISEEFNVRMSLCNGLFSINWKWNWYRLVYWLIRNRYLFYLFVLIMNYDGETNQPLNNRIHAFEYKNAVRSVPEVTVIISPMYQ